MHVKGHPAEGWGNSHRETVEGWGNSHRETAEGCENSHRQTDTGRRKSLEDCAPERRGNHGETSRSKTKKTKTKIAEETFASRKTVRGGLSQWGKRG